MDGANPVYAEAHHNLGVALKEQGKLEEAAGAYRKAIAAMPDLAEAHYNLGVVLMDEGKLDEAVASYRKAITLKPDYAKAHSNLLFCLHYIPGLTLEGVFAEHRRPIKRRSLRARRQAALISWRRTCLRRIGSPSMT